MSWLTGNGSSSQGQRGLDPFCGHEWTMRGSERRNRPEGGGAASSMLMGTGSRRQQSDAKFGVPMQNVSEYTKHDPFLTKYSANVTRPRIKVSITHGTDFPEFDGKCQLYCTVQIPGMAKSRLSTPVDHQYWGNPVWNFPDKQVWGWLPGKPLLFEVRNKAIKEGLAAFGMGQDDLVGTATLDSEAFYPDGLQRKLDIHSQDLQHKGYIYVEIKAYCGRDRSFFEAFMHKLFLAFSNGGTYLQDFVEQIPAHLQALGYEAQLLLGPEYPTRIPGEKWSMIWPAFAIYFLVYFVYCYVGLFRHHTIAGLFDFIVICLFGAYLLNLVNGNFKRKPLGAPRSCLFGVCFFSFLVSYLLASNGWNYAWAQWWWMFTGFKTEGTASTPAAARVDASSISFGNRSSTSVDANRGAGYRIGGDIYCAAPIMDPTMVAAQIPLINYWAIGINCCDDFGSFTCDASRSYKGAVGVAMVPKGTVIDGPRGLPCIGCNHDYFRLATLKSSSEFGLVSSTATVWVRYVRAREEVTIEHFIRGVWDWIWSAVVAYCLIYLAAWTVNFHGWGKPVSTMSASDMRHQKASQAATRFRAQEEKKNTAGCGMRIC